MQRLHTLLTLGLAWALAGCASLTPSVPERDKTYAITILHTNDHHGRFWKNRDGEYGMAARKTVVDQIRQEVKAAGGYSLLLDGGDVNTGVPESDLQDAVPDFRGMNLLGYDAMAVGNHEFDKPPVVLQMQRDLASFPMLSANIYKDGSRMFAPYKVFNLGGVRVGVMGLTTEDTQKMVHPDNVRGVTFANVQTETAKVLPELRQKADVVIAATHMGHYEDGKHGVQAAGDVELARAVKGLDMIVGGHSQNPVCMKAENVVDRVPLVRSVYSGLKQITETFFAKSEKSFDKTCLVEFPRPGCWAVGFVATTAKGEIAEKLPTDRKMIAVFVALTPLTSGILMFLPEEDVILLDMKADEVVKLIVSAGLVAPTAKEVRALVDQAGGDQAGA